MVDFINSNMRNFFFSNIAITITTFCKKLPTLSALVNHISWTLKQNLLACEAHFLIILQSECSQGSLSITGRVPSREILCNAHVILHAAAWDLSCFGQEASATPGPGNPGSRWWFGAETVDGHLQSAVRYEGSASLWMAAWDRDYSHHWGVGMFSTLIFAVKTFKQPSDLEGIPTD